MEITAPSWPQVDLAETGARILASRSAVSFASTSAVMVKQTRAARPATHRISAPATASKTDSTMKGTAWPLFAGFAMEIIVVMQAHQTDRRPRGCQLVHVDRCHPRFVPQRFKLNPYHH